MLERLPGQAQTGERLHARRRLALPDHRQRGAPADGLGQHRRHAVDGSSTLGSERAEHAARPPRTRAKAGRPTTSTRRASPETACSVGMAPTCTDPNLNTTFAADEDARRDRARCPTRSATRRARAGTSSSATAGWTPTSRSKPRPRAGSRPKPTSPRPNGSSRWTRAKHRSPSTGTWTRAASTPAAWKSPRARSRTTRPTSASGDFASVPSSYCDGSTVHTKPFNGLLANVSTATLEAMFPKGDPTSFTGNENGGLGPDLQRPPQHASPTRSRCGSWSRPPPGAAGPAMTGEDRRQLFLHRDAEMLKGFPLEMKGDGDASPVLVDLAGDDPNQLIVANSDGWIHAYRYNPTAAPSATCPAGRCTPKRCRCTPASMRLQRRRADDRPLRPGDRGAGRRRPVRRRRTGRRRRRPAGQRLRVERERPAGLPRDLQPRLLGRAAVRRPRLGGRSATACASAPRAALSTSPVLADLEPETGPGLDIIAAGEDRHVYAWQPDGEAGQGLPGAGRGSRQGRVGRPDQQRADVQRQRAGQPETKTKTRARSSTRPPSPTSTGPASRRRSSSAPTRST